MKTKKFTSRLVVLSVALTGCGTDPSGEVSPSSHPDECEPGLIRDPESGQCVVVPEPDQCTKVCAANEKCKNTAGTQTCECKPGFNRDPVSGQCVVASEPDQCTKVCAANEKCKNTAGTQTCECKTGYVHETIGATTGCVDADFAALAFNEYHDLAAIAAYFESVSAAFPVFMTTRSLGTSAKGRSIDLLVMNATGLASPPSILAIGTHHGDEKVSTEAVLAVADYLLMHRQESAVRTMLSTYAFSFVPVVNPDGYVANTREDSTGADLNRDYAGPTKNEAASFSSKETLLIRYLQDQQRFHAAFTYHAGMTGILWPWCYTGTATADHDLFFTISRNAAQAMGFDTYMQSYEDFESVGEYVDFAYMKTSTLAFTVEVATAKAPSASRLAGYMQTTILGTWSMLQDISAHDAGTLTIDSERAAAYRPRIASDPNRTEKGE